MISADMNHNRGRRLWKRSISVEIHPDMVEELERLLEGTDRSREEALVAAFRLLQTHVDSQSGELERTISAAYSPKEPRAFICHAKEDADFAIDMSWLLEERGVKPWLDLENLLPGDDWDLEIQAAILGTDVIIILLSGNSVSKKGYVQKEIKRALEVADLMPEGRGYIIPVLLDKVQIPTRLSKWQALSIDDDDFYSKLRRAIVKAAGGITKP